MSIELEHYDLAYNAAALEVIRSPDTSRWLKEALRLALDRDCVDAANDAQLLAEVLAKRSTHILSLGAATQAHD